MFQALNHFRIPLLCFIYSIYNAHIKPPSHTTFMLHIQHIQCSNRSTIFAYHFYASYTAYTMLQSMCPCQADTSKMHQKTLQKVVCESGSFWLSSQSDHFPNLIILEGKLNIWTLVSLTFLDLLRFITLINYLKLLVIQWWFTNINFEFKLVTEYLLSLKLNAVINVCNFKGAYFFQYHVRSCDC